MARYHVNPSNGKPGVCKAKLTCPFGDLETEHYPSRARAEEVYAGKQDFMRLVAEGSIIKPKAGTYQLEVYSRTDDDLLIKASKTMELAPDNSRIVVENGQVWEKAPIYGSDTWRLVSGPQNNMKLDSVYDGTHVRWQLKSFGGRLEAGGRRQELLDSSQVSNVSDSVKPIAESINAKIHSVTGVNSIAVEEAESVKLYLPVELYNYEINKIAKDFPNLTYHPNKDYKKSYFELETGSQNV